MFPVRFFFINELLHHDCLGGVFNRFRWLMWIWLFCTWTEHWHFNDTNSRQETIQKLYQNTFFPYQINLGRKKLIKTRFYWYISITSWLGILCFTVEFYEDFKKNVNNTQFKFLAIELFKCAWKKVWWVFLFAMLTYFIQYCSFMMIIREEVEQEWQISLVYIHSLTKYFVT